MARSLERLALGLEAVAKDRQALEELQKHYTIVGRRGVGSEYA